MNAQLPMPALHDAPWPPAQFEAQQRALDILQFKLDILWSILDAVEKAWPL